MSLAHTLSYLRNSFPRLDYDENNSALHGNLYSAFTINLYTELACSCVISPYLCSFNLFCRAEVVSEMITLHLCSPRKDPEHSWILVGRNSRMYDY